MSKYIIYALQDPITFEIRYIGKSCSGFKRIKRHFSNELETDSNTHKKHWIKQLKNKGYLPSIIIIQQFQDNINLSKCEYYWINYFKSIGCPLINLVNIEQNTIYTKEHKDNLSSILKERYKNPEYKLKHKNSLKPFNESIKGKVSKSNATKQNWKNPEYKERQLNKLHSGWTAKKESICKHNKEIQRKNFIKLIDQFGNIYESGKDASRKLNIPRPYISAVINGRQKSTKGYEFRRLK